MLVIPTYQSLEHHLHTIRKRNDPDKEIGVFFLSQHSRGSKLISFCNIQVGAMYIDEMLRAINRSDCERTKLVSGGVTRLVNTGKKVEYK